MMALEQGALAHAVAAHQPDGFAALHGKVDAAQDVAGAVVAVEAGGADQQVGRCSGHQCSSPEVGGLHVGGRRGSAAGVPVAITWPLTITVRCVGQREDGVHVVFDQQHGVVFLDACSSSSTMRSASATPMPASGSSSSSTCGSVASVIAISNWRCSPWLMVPAITHCAGFPGARPARWHGCTAPPGRVAEFAGLAEASAAGSRVVAGRATARPGARCPRR
jgi:hypothetical protein